MASRSKSKEPQNSQWLLGQNIPTRVVINYIMVSKNTWDSYKNKCIHETKRNNVSSTFFERGLCLTDKDSARKLVVHLMIHTSAEDGSLISLATVHIRKRVEKHIPLRIMSRNVVHSPISTKFVSKLEIIELAIFFIFFNKIHYL